MRLVHCVCIFSEPISNALNELIYLMRYINRLGENTKTELLEWMKVEAFFISLKHTSTSTAALSRGLCVQVCVRRRCWDTGG